MEEGFASGGLELEVERKDLPFKRVAVKISMMNLRVLFIQTGMGFRTAVLRMEGRIMFL